MGKFVKKFRDHNPEDNEETHWRKFKKNKSHSSAKSFKPNQADRMVEDKKYPTKFDEDEITQEYLDELDKK